MDVKWHEWCRLCARSGDIPGIETIDLNSDSNSQSISTAIGKYFWVNIKPSDVNKHVCLDCYSLVNLLVSFTERVNKVQAMFLMLQSTKSSQLEPNEVRSQFDLLDEDWEHIIKSDKKNNDNEIEEIETLEEDEQIERGHCDMNSQECINDKNVTAFPNHFDYDSDSKDETEIEDKVETIEGERTQESEDDNMAFIEINNQNELPIKRKKLHKDLENIANIKLTKSEETTKKSTISPNTSKYRCKSCGKNYKNATSYRKHLESHNLVSDLPDFMCDECGKILATERQLTQHKRTHLPLEEKLTVQCPHCEKKYINEAVLKQHVIHMHTEHSYVCEECGMTLKRLASLKDHKLTHSNLFRFKCESCDKVFKNKARLKAHIDAVHSSTTYQCNQCNLKLNSKRTLKMHMLVHTNEKGYKCNFCGAEFKRGKTLKNHLIIHIGLRPYKCNFCEKTFTNGSNCRAHKKKLHPLELSAEESSGLTNKSTIVPNLYELQASESVQEPRSSVRNQGGITPKMRALLVAAEQLDSDKESFMSTMTKSTKPRVQHFKFNNESSEFHEVTELVAENDPDCYDQESETLVFEVIDEDDFL